MKKMLIEIHASSSFMSAKRAEARFLALGQSTVEVGKELKVEPQTTWFNNLPRTLETELLDMGWIVASAIATSRVDARLVRPHHKKAPRPRAEPAAQSDFAKKLFAAFDAADRKRSGRSDSK